MRSSGWLGVLLLSTFACTAREEPAGIAAGKAAPTEAVKPASVAAAPPVAPPAVPPAVPPVVPPATPPVVPAPEVAVAPVEPAAAVPPADAAAPGEAGATGPILAAVPIVPTPITVTWREVTRQAPGLSFEGVTRGVLAKSASGGYLDIDDSGALVLRPEIEAPAAPVLGSWPDNAWYIETRTRTDPNDRAMEEIRELRLMRLRGKRRWVPQEYNFEQRFLDHGEQFQIGGAGGLIVARDESLTRISDNGTDPVLGQDIGGSLVAFFETRSGKVYTVRDKDGVLYVQRDCADPECVTREATKLPLGTQWSFTQPVTRQKHSVSAVAEARVEEASQMHLLHYETGGWKLESIDREPEGLWPTKDGGLWTIIDAKLLHRDPNGAWRAVALPQGATSVTAAMRPDYSELWIAATVGDESIVFATAAEAQTPAPAPAAP